MRTPTPRGLPAVVLPAPAPGPVAHAPKPLAGPVCVRCAATEVELRHGSMLVGRGSDCELVIEDALVSRMHARIQIDHEGVWVEDLYSTNGVYLNGERILQPRLLHSGDRLFVGSHELDLVEVRMDAAPSVPPFSAHFSDPPTHPTRDVAALALEIPITARTDALDLLGSLARRLANDVKAEQAPRMLGPHLEGILRGAGAGLVVPEALGELASEYAIDLAHWTSQARWLDYVVELHLVTKRMMSAATISALQRSERWIGHLDRSLLDHYVGSFATRSAELDASAKGRLATLRRILKKK